MEPTFRDQVRRRPGMYAGGLDGFGVLNLVFEIVANAVDQRLMGRCETIDVCVERDGTIVVEDDGPGIPAHGNGLLPPIDVLVTSRFDTPTVDGHRPHVHLSRMGGFGLVVVNALSESFELITVCDGVEARIVCARGEIVEPVAMRAVTGRAGTRVRFRPDPTLFVWPRVPRGDLARRLEELQFLIPGITLRWAFEGDDLAAAGLAVRVAVAVPCALADVVHGRETVEADAGPIDVEIALAWRDRTPWFKRRPSIESWVNFEQTPQRGTHVWGLLTGIARHFGRAQARLLRDQLVAAVAVVLADVKYGNPTQERLVTPAVQGVVEAVTTRALEAWAAANPDAAARLRERAMPDR